MSNGAGKSVKAYLFLRGKMAVAYLFLRSMRTYSFVEK